MNYKLEGNINFSEELYKLICEDDLEEEEEDEVCLISGEKLKENFVKLNCGHKFNYGSIFNELINQRKKNRLETQTTKSNEIKCPYCRTITKGILPWYIGYNKIKNVNWSSTNKKIMKKCKVILKSGKRKGQECGCNVKYGDYCGRHKKYYTQQPTVNSIIQEENSEPVIVI